MANPAQRLHDALSKFRQYNNRADRLDQIWPEVFGLEELTQQEILVQIAEFLALPRIVETAVSNIPKEMPQELVLEWVPKVQNVFEYVLPDRAISNAGSRVTDDLLYGLRISAALLEQHKPDKLIVTEQLNELNSRAKKLRDDVLNSEIEEDLKKLVTVRLLEVIMAMNAFAITGVEGVERAFEGILGSMVKDPKKWEKIGGTSVGKKVFKFVKNLGVILTFAWTAFQIGDRVQHYLHDEPSSQQSATDQAAPKRSKRSIEI